MFVIDKFIGFFIILIMTVTHVALTGIVLSALLVGSIHAAVTEGEHTPTRIACVGDSITYGLRIPGRLMNCFPVVLGNLLGDNYTVGNFGRNGATAMKRGNNPYWGSPQYKSALQFEPNIAIIMLGTNDADMWNWLEHGDEYEPDLADLVRTFQALQERPKVFLCYPPPVFQAFPQLRGEIIARRILPRVRAAAEETLAPIINIYDALKDRPELFPDGVHPNAEGARIIAETVFKAIAEPSPSQAPSNP